MTPTRVDLKFQHPKDEWHQFLGQKLTQDNYDMLIDYDADVFTPEGEILMRLRKNCIPNDVTARAFNVLRKIRAKTSNRTVATLKGVGGRRIRKDGVVSHTWEVPKDMAIMSNIIGFYDRYVRFPYCRQTAFNANEAAEFEECLPFFQAITRAYQAADPERFAIQEDAVKKVHPAWIVPGTLFSTITVNQNWQTAVHTDKGDFKGGMGCITVLRGGEFTGGSLVFPHYRIATHFDSCDLLLFNSHHLHGNVPIRGKVGGFERVSCVLYLREKMHQCGSPEEELKRAKNRQPGQKLYHEDQE